MSMVWVDSQSLTDIADAIRSKNGESGTYLVSEMPGKIENISTENTGYKYYITTSSVSDTAAAILVVVINNKTLVSSTTYRYDNSNLFHKWMTINNIKIRYGMSNNDYKWYIACNSGSVINMSNNTVYYPDETIASWQYTQWKNYTIFENV